MKLSTAVILNVLALWNMYVIYVAGADPEPFTTSTPNTTTFSPYTTTSPPYTTTSSPYTTASSPYTTASPPYTTTSSPYTTTSSPYTTTSSPYTTTSPPSTTTSSPYTTTTSPYTTTSSPYTTTISTSTTDNPTPTRPTPTPKPETGRWMVEFSTGNSACIFLEMAASVDFYYINIWDEIEKRQINIPANASSTGSCGETGGHNQYISLLWSFSSNYINAFELTFRKNDHVYEIDKIIVNVTLDPQSFPTAKDAGRTLTLINNNNHFFTPEKVSYKCNKQHTLPLYLSRNHVDVGHLKINHIYFQAFHNITSTYLAKGIDCNKTHQTRTVLFILPGCIIVIVIFLIIIFKKRRHPYPRYIYVVDAKQSELESMGNGLHLATQINKDEDIRQKLII